MEQKLNGRRIAALAADGFEKVELTIPIYALRFAGATVDVVSLRHGRIRGVNLHEPAGRVRVDKTVEEADPRRMTLCCSRADLSIPICCGNHSARANLCEFVRAFDSAGKPIASLRHGPWVLASAGVRKGVH